MKLVTLVLCVLLAACGTQTQSLQLATSSLIYSATQQPDHYNYAGPYQFVRSAPKE